MGEGGGFFSQIRRHVISRMCKRSLPNLQDTVSDWYRSGVVPHDTYDVNSSSACARDEYRREAAGE